ncbi:hypothetical protein Pmar_PMAR015458 [Perkinsus marinus ATCC 50983]|uniref:Uncharacterized protein n=1 Tax=Perkinsus marinus (strain ATCC 50983 / TXsc) TaxID=423536 RepID=C5L890_PERM5|nr:hypothetical protein Pmar_PMAR015458 [Perkinsus marinus ATCC 50983]EER07046.1 hypothetical protein Pmar_PMAR015458 [Perkinsus marinus ATCC 50983]|eukprot:XP_002775230.1 hypothetical protein Pmar_PMAR015458 [Perkinsus marinus ATCC 50983]
MLIFNANDGSKLSDMLELSTLPTPKLSKKPQRDHAACQASVMTFNKLTRAKNHIKGMRQTKALVKFLCHEAMTMGEQFAGTEESEMVPQTLRPAEDDPDTEENDEQADDDDDWMSLRKMEVEELFKRKISS